MQTLNRLLAPHNGPCASWFVPTHRRASEEDVIRWKNALAEVNRQFQQAGVSAEAKRRANSTGAGLAQKRRVLARIVRRSRTFLTADGKFEFFRLSIAFQERAHVGSRFCITPLLPMLQDEAFFILALSPKHVQLFQATCFTVEPVDVPGLPESEAEALCARRSRRGSQSAFSTGAASGPKRGSLPRPRSRDR